MKKMYFGFLTIICLLLSSVSNAQTNYAGSFDGSTFISVPHSSSIDLGSTFTIEAWVYYSGGNKTIIDKGNYDYLFQCGQGGDVLGFYNANSGWKYSTGSVSQNTWTHVAVTLSGGTLTFYINGVASGTASVNATQDSGPMNIGRQSPYTCSCNLYNGNMDELRLWNVARTQSEIQANMNTSLSPSSTGLAAYYQFNEGSGTTLVDATSNGNSGTWQGTSGYATSGVTITAICTPTTGTFTVTACDSYSWVAKGNTVYTASNNTDTIHLTNAGGCDSLVTLNLTINASSTSSTTVTSCDSLRWNGTKYTTSGTYTYSTTNAAGCDSTATLNLTINASSTSSTTVTSCDSLVWNATTYTTSGTYTWGGTNAAGCDSTATLNVTINHPSTSSTTTSACDSLRWNGTNYTTSGTYTWGGTNAVGCDSTATLNLTINHPSTSSTTTSACDSLVWNATTYTTSGTYTWGGTNAAGCDSTATLNVTINHPSTSSTTTSACDSLRWNGTNYTTSGTYTWGGTNAAGCDSTATLNLTINHPSTSSTTTSACDSLVWNGTTYTTSGTYTYSTTNAVGCDSTATLNLTINNSSTSSTSVTSCDSLRWNGTNYTTSGTYTYSTTNAAGCDSTATLNLTINASSTSSTSVTSCDSLRWNGTNYTTSGTYTYSTTNAVGCDSTATLNLTINNSSTSSTTVTSCDSLRWNGTNYTTSGTYTYSTTNAAGCDSTATLNLTINNSSTSSTSVTSCDSLRWNGTNYTTSGTYTYSTTNAAGCDSTATLNLTINASSNSSTSVTSCDSLRWNGTNYTTSGTYTYSTTNAVGCDSTATLNLTINASSTSSTSVTSCDSLRWNGTNYTTSGTYTYSTTNAVGCDSTATLNLTIKNSSSSTLTTTVCDSLIWNGTIYRNSGSYTVHFTNAVGCDSAAILILTVNYKPTVAPIVGLTNIEILAIGGGGGAGGPDGALGAGGGAGGVVYGAYTLSTTGSSIYTVGVGGAGGYGQGCAGSAVGGTAGANGGAAGGNAGTGGCSGGGGGSGGWSGLYQGSNFVVVAGGGAGGGGSNEGTANDVTTPGGGNQSAANGTSMTGQNGTAYSGDGGGGGAGGGGFYGGAGQSNLTQTGFTASQAYGGANYTNTTGRNSFATYIGNSGATTSTGTGGQGTTSTITNASDFNYSTTYGKGGNAQGNGGTSTTANGNNGVVIIRYSGSPVASGGTVTQSGGYTLHTFTTAGSNTFTANSGNSVCAGSTTTLNCATTGGVWTSSDTSIASINASTGLVTGKVAGTVTITYTVTNAQGCVGTSTKSFTVNPLPTVPAITGTTTICDNTTTQLSNTLTGGVWSSSLPAKATINASTGLVTSVALGSGSTTVTYLYTDNNGCSSSVNTTVTINASPTVAAIAGNNGVCIGSTTTFTDATTGGTWTSGTPSVATINSSGLISTVAAGASSTISYTVINASACTTVVTKSITVFALPNVTANATASTVCFGTLTTLTGGNASSYTWNNGVTNNVAFAPSATNTYTVTGTDGNGCVKTANITITVNSLPTVSISPSATTLCNGYSSTLTASGANTYGWTIVGSTPYLDQVSSTSTLKLAAGLHKLKNSYSGSAIRIRRSSDNTEADFGFSGNDLDIASISTFIGAGTAYVKTLYDQSGNGNHLSQTSTGNQPALTLSGLNGKPVIHTNTSQNIYTTTNFTTPFSIVYAARQTGGSRGRMLADWSGNNWLLGWWNGNKGAAHFNGWVGPSGGTGASDNSVYIYTGTATGSNSSFVYQNGTNITANSSGGNAGPNGLTMNRWENGNEPSDADFTDLIEFNSVLSTTDRQIVENGMGAYYGLSGFYNTTGATTTVTPNTTSSYTVYGTNSNGCVGTATQAITVNPKPNAGSDVNFICGGATQTLTGTANTGTWTALGTNPTGATLSSTTSGVATVSFANLASGTFSFIYTLPTTNCSDTMSITVRPKPNAGNDQAICILNVATGVTLTSNITGSWAAMTGNAGTANIATPNAQSTLVNNFSVIGDYNYINTNNGCTDTVKVTVTPAASIGNYVWKDQNNDGLQNEATANGVNGITVELYQKDVNGNFNLYTSTTTANDGSGNPGYYNFGICEDGIYKVKVPTVNPYTQTHLTTQDSTAATDGNSDVNPSTGYSREITIDTHGTGVAKDNNTIDAGYQICTKPIAGNDFSVCNTSSLNITGTSTTPALPTTDGNWSVMSGNPSGATLGSTTLGVAAVSFERTGIFNFIYSVTGGCDDTLAITVNPLPTATIAGTIDVCNNASSPSITFVGSNATAPYTFTYTINGGSPLTVTSTGDTARVTVSTSTVGTFTYTLVSVRDASSTTCLNTASGSATVVVNPLPAAAISGTTDVCRNSATPSILFTGSNATAPYTFTYTINGGSQQTVTTSFGDTVSVIVPTGTAGTYVYALVSVRDASSTTCLNAASGSATVVVNPLPTATIGGTTAVCRNSSSPNITFTGANATAPYTFTYTINGGSQQTVTTTSGNSVTVPVSTSTVGTYTYALVSVRDASSTTCLNTAAGSATVRVNPLPIANIGGTTTLCQNSSSPYITFAGSNATAPYTFTYTINGGSQRTVTTAVGSATVNVAVPTNTAGTYVYALVSVRDASSTACLNAASGSATVVVNPLPTATITGTTSVCQYQTATPLVTFTGANATAPYTFIYTINGGSQETITTISGNSVTVAVPTYDYGTFTYSLVSVRESSSTTCINTPSTSATVTIYQKPDAGADLVEICGGSIIPLTGTPSGGIWSQLSSNVSGATVGATNNGVANISFANLVSSTYTFVYTLASGCTDTMTISTKPKPNAGVDKYLECGSTQRTDAIAATPTGGLWTAQAGNPTGIVLGTTVSGGASLSLPAAPATGTWYFIYTAPNGCTDTMKYTIGVNGNPAPVINMGSSPICNSSTVQLCPSVFGWGNYQWYRNGVAISGQRGAGACITIDTSNVGSYTVSGTNGSACWSLQSTPIVISASAPSTPIISVTGSTSVCSGASVTLTSSASTGNQWKKDGVVISGATSQTFSATTSGVYTVTVTNCGSSTSVGTTVTVAAPITVAAISSSTNSVCLGSTISLTDATTGGVWSSSNTAVATINSSGVVTPVATGVTVISYTVTVGGCSNAAIYSLSVQSGAPSAPTIVAQSSTALCGTNTVQLCPSVYGWSNYQWYKNGVAVTTNGASACIVIDTAKLGSYTLSVTTGTCWSAQSNAITVTTTSAPATPTIGVTGSTSVCSGGSVLLTSSATSGNQWKKDGVAISGATAQTYSATAGGVYTVTVTVCGSSTSAGTTVTVASPITVAAISASTNSICLGGTVNMTNATTGGIWSSSNTAVATINASGVVTTLSAGNTTISYTVTLGGCSNASTYSLSVQSGSPSAPTIVAQSSTSLCGTNTVQLCPSVYGWSNYQWYKNGVAITTNGASACIVIDTAKLGSYTLAVTTGTCWSAQSNAVVISTTAAPATPTISVSGSTSICNGASVTLTSSATNGNQWNKDGVAISGATAQTYSATASGVYTVTVTVCGSSTSAGTTVTVAAPITVAAISSSTNSVCLGSTTTLTNATTGGVWSSSNTAVATINASGVVTTISAGNTTISYTKTVSGCSAAATFSLSVLGSTVATPTLDVRGSTVLCGTTVLQICPATYGWSNYQWYKNGVAIAAPTGTGACINIDTSATGSYTLTGTNGFGCWSSPSTAVVVTKSSTPATPTISASGSTSICNGAGVTLTSSATSGNQWNKDGVAISGATAQTYSATTSGVYTVTVTICGSTTSAGTTVTVASPISIAAISASTSSICLGGTVTMTNATTGGVWSSSNTAVATINASGVVTTIGAGNTTISYTKTVGGCSAAATFTLSVLGSTVATPTLDIRGSVNICGSGSLQMCPLVWGYSNYQWYKDGVPYSTSSCITVNTAGSYTLTGTNGSGCWSAPSAPANVTINAIPTVVATTGATSVCIGSSIALSNTSTIPSGGTGVWTSIAGRATVNNAGIVTGTSAGVATLVYTVTSAVGCSSSASYNVTVNSLPGVPSIGYASGTVNPQAGATGGAFCANKTFTVVGTPSGGVWSKTGVITVTTPGGVVNTGSVAGAGSLTYTYTDANGCSNARTLTSNVMVCAGKGVNSNQPIDQSTNQQFTMYPNPAKTFIRINVETLIGQGQIVITDLYGKQIKTQPLSLGTNTIDIAKFSKGFYLVSVVTSTGKDTKKLVVE